MRDEFYEKKWNINSIERHSIYVSQGGYPIKGLHIVLEALNILKHRYPDIKLYVAGRDITKCNSIMEIIKYSNYHKIISKMIKKYNLQQYIKFTGQLNATQVTEKMLKSNVYVQASSIENSSNALGEAMIIGVPCVASYVGGTPDIIKDKEEGLLYPFGDYALLAHYISKVFDDDRLALKLGKNAKMHAEITHNRIINEKE